MRNGLLLILAVLLANAPAFAADSEAAPGKTYVYKQSAGKSQEIEIYFPPGWKADGRPSAVILSRSPACWTTPSAPLRRAAGKNR